MSRPVVLSNGDLHVGINKHGLVHDFYYPYVGLENHSSGPNTRHRVGIWAEGRISWLDDGSWSLNFDYHPETLIGKITAVNDDMAVRLEFEDAVDSGVNAFMRSIKLTNLGGNRRDIRLFTHQAFAIGDGRSNTDTAQYLPDSNAILHYRGRRVFVVSGSLNGQPFDQHTMGIFGIEGREGTYRDADDGELNICNVEHGRVDSTLRFRIELEAEESANVHYWIAAGKTNREALYVHQYISQTGVLKALGYTARHWQQWLEPAKKFADNIDPKFKDIFLKSTLIIKSQIDNRGAIMASTDSAMLNYSRDAYAYCWPRDGAYIVWPLIRMGYKEEPLRFFQFMKRGLHSSGYLVHKYRADGAYGSSWHPYIHDDVVGPPIQEDETAGVLFVFAQFYDKQQDPKLLKEFYEPMIKPMADFMSDYIDSATSLPKPSYDLWEEVYQTTTYTTAITHAALLAAADLAEAANDEASSVKWRSVAGDIRVAAKKHLYSSDRKSFRKGLIVKGGYIEYDDRIDSSNLFGVFMYSLFPLESDEVKSSVATLESAFAINNGTPGIPRYENDPYQRKDASSIGNWWIITSLWLAQYYTLIGMSDKAMSTLEWVQNHAQSSGVLPEQINPSDGSSISVAPLTWSHAEYISTLLDTIQK